MDGPIPPRPSDPLGEALHLLRMDGAFYCRSELRAPWGLELPALPGYLWFHVVTTGGVLLEVDREHCRWLHPGDIALVPHGNGHVLRSEPGVPAPDVMELHLEHPSDRYEILRHGGGGAPPRPSSVARSASTIPSPATSLGSCRHCSPSRPPTSPAPAGCRASSS